MTQSLAIAANRLAQFGLIAFIALLPFARLSEIGIFLCLLSSVIAISGKGYAPLRLSAGIAAWLCLAGAAISSSVDSFNPALSWSSSTEFLRFLALPIAAQQLSAAQRRTVCTFAAGVICVWMLDALVQASTGWSLGGNSYRDRISGVFGEDNLKLGLVLAVFSPIALFALEVVAKKSQVSVAVLSGLRAVLWLSFAVAILVAGARAGWVMFALVSLLWWFRIAEYRWRRASAGLVVGLVIALMLGALLNATNARFAERWARTQQIFNASTADFALAGRIPIWHTAGRMVAAHPINGVGIRAFRYAYPQFAEANDPWVQPAAANEPATGATHPHQLLLEILSETGVIGLIFWLVACVFMVRAWRGATQHARALAWPFGCALLVLVFPINTHTAMYSSFWAGVLWWLIALLCAELDAKEQA